QNLRRHPPHLYHQAMNKLVIAAGGNVGNVFQTLKLARLELENIWGRSECSDFFTSKAVDYTNQADFINQVWCFDLPNIKAIDALDLILQIEQKFGRLRTIPKGPRTIDLDMIFFGNLHYDDDQLQLPHPRFLQRS